MMGKTDERIQKRQLTFYAFLNKEFNIMNYKANRCSLHCFDNLKTSILSVNQCLGVCGSGIKKCEDFVFNIQRSTEEELERCTTQASEVDRSKDPTIRWISCYEQLFKRYDDMEKEIKEEFNHFI
jgi:hypothetical protein